ncbi:TPA: RHS repeat-associated core domain-containing protein, partial [Pseudomonas aeruginosa]|nr:Rhs family-like protein [Pseudomonas aeruginosa]HEJ1667962.1 Rhs family-like protein [Pseudomonas aeruginosa]
NDGGRSWQDAYVGDYLILRKEGGAVKKLYLLRDALGSVEILLDANGAVSERQSFAAFGEHRGADWKDNGNQPTATSTRRGFTGHEHLEESGLVHMNGRVYDPVIGRFLSADIVYQDTANAQAYNRYSYGWNNPIASVDPTGYALEEISSGNSWYSPFISNSWLVLGNAFKGNLPDSYWDLGVGAFKQNLNFAATTLAGNPFSIYGFSRVSESFDNLLSPKGVDQRAGAGVYELGSLFFPTAGDKVSGWVAGFASRLRFAPALRGGIGVSSPAWKGSGPTPGVLGVEPGSLSSKSLRNYYPSTDSGSIEYVFDPISKSFAVGRPKDFRPMLSQHQQLADSIGAADATVVGGKFWRGPNGEFFTNEYSGHYWRNWSEENRKVFVDVMNKYGVKVEHRRGM